MEQFNTPTIKALLLKTFGKEQRKLIEKTLKQLDKEAAATFTARPARAKKATVAASREEADVLMADPFKTIDSELRQKDTGDNYGAVFEE